MGDGQCTWPAITQWQTFLAKKILDAQFLVQVLPEATVVKTNKRVQPAEPPAKELLGLVCMGIQQQIKCPLFIILMHLISSQVFPHRLWQMYMMGTPGILRIRLFRSLSQVATMQHLCWELRRGTNCFIFSNQKTKKEESLRSHAVPRKHCWGHNLPRIGILKFSSIGSRCNVL